MHPRVRGAVVIAAAWIPCAVSFADNPPTDPGLPTDPASTEPGVTEPPPVHRKLDPPPQPAVIEPAAPSAFTWRPFGYLRMQYIAVQDDPNVAFVGRDDGFELQNARAGVTGMLGKRMALTLSIDGAVDERTQVNSPQGKLAFGLRDAYGDVALGGNAVVRAGYFLSTVDPEALIPDTAREFVDNPIETRGMRATEGWQTPGLPPGRSLGVAIRLDPEYALGGVPVHLDHPALGFEVAIQNGADEFASNNDNDEPALSATAILRFPHDSWLMVAGRYNPRTIGDLPFRQDETDLQGTVGLHVAAGPVSLGGALILQQTTFDTTGGPSQDAYGAHAQVMFTIPAPLPFSVGYRFGVLDPSSLITTDQVMEHTLGAVLGVPSYRMRLQLQVTHVVEQPARDLANDRIQLAAEVVL